MRYLALAVLLAPMAAFAEGGGKGDEGWKACRADKDKLCAGSPNPGICLHDNWEKLSPECRSFKERMKSQWQNKQAGKHGGADPLKQACGGDMERLCSGQDWSCMKAKWEQVSPGCKDYKAAMHKQWQDKQGGQQAQKQEKQGKMKFEWSQKKEEQFSAR